MSLIEGVGDEMYQLNEAQDNVVTPNSREPAEEVPDAVVEPNSSDARNASMATASDVDVENKDDAVASTSSTNGATETSSSEATPRRPLVRLKFLDDTQRLVNAVVSETVRQFKCRHFAVELDEGRTIRLIYNGQVLRDEMQLSSYALCDNSVLHCHISDPSNINDLSQGSAIITPADNRDESLNANISLNPGRYFRIILGINFLLVWLGWLKYSQFFDFTSVFALSSLTAIYLVFVFASSTRNA